MRNLIHAPIPSVKSPSDPDKLCSPLGNSCNPVSSSRFLFKGPDNTWKRQKVSSFHSRDANFGRITNDRVFKREMSEGARAIIQTAKAKASARKEYFLSKSKEMKHA